MTFDIQYFDSDGRWSETQEYRGQQGIIVAFSLNDRKSFEEVETRWIREIAENASGNTVVGIVGCKSDLGDRQVTLDEAKVLNNNTNEKRNEKQKQTTRNQKEKSKSEKRN